MIRKNRTDFPYRTEEVKSDEETAEKFLSNLEEPVKEEFRKSLITDEYREEVKLGKTCFKITMITDNYIIAHNDLKGNVWVRLSDISDPVIGKEIYR